MWFAGRPRRNPWFRSFCARLLENSPDTVALRASNPFPAEPPRYIRATVYDYRFSDRATWDRERVWWRRTALGPYGPILSRGRN